VQREIETLTQTSPTVGQRARARSKTSGKGSAAKRHRMCKEFELGFRLRVFLRWIVAPSPEFQSGFRTQRQKQRVTRALGAFCSLCSLSRNFIRFVQWERVGIRG